MVGMHTVITPLIVNEITTVGSSLLFSKALAANLAIGGAALAVGIKAKKAENKQAGLSTGVTALLSVTEPALYGCLIRLKKPLVSAIVASAIAGIFIGVFDIRAYATASCSFLTLPIFMGGPMSNFYLACAAAVLAAVLGCSSNFGSTGGSGSDFSITIDGSNCRTTAFKCWSLIGGGVGGQIHLIADFQRF